MKTLKLLITLLISAIYVNGWAQQYTPVPTEVNGVNKTIFSLNGTWQFNPSPEKSFWKLRAVNDWKNIEVPGEWVMQGYNVKPHTRAAYFKEFNVPKDWNNSEIILRCDAIYSDAIVYVNDQKVGAHEGGFNAFEFNVTQFLKLREKNNISIGVMSESFSDTIVSATQYAAHQLGGITRKIYLFALPKVHISDLEVTTTFDEEYINAKLGIKYELQNYSKTELSNTKIVFTLISPDGKSKELGEKNINVIEGNIEFNINESQKWNAEHPNLYTLKVELKNGKDSEVIHRTIGFRQIEVIGNQFYVNGKPIKLKGVNRHEVHPLRGRSLTEELWRKDAQIFKEGNCNYIRTSHYPPAEEFIAFCDSIGLFVELEAPFCWIGHNANIKFKRKEQLPENMAEIYKPRLAETIEFYRKHPSIIIWSMANESGWTEEWNKAKEYINKLDNTRPKSFHDQDYGGYNNYGSTTEVSNIHYPGPNGADNVKNYNRPILFGEYTHLNTYNRKEIATDPGVRDAWGRGFEPMWNNMYYSRGCLGGAIWAGIDDVFHIPNAKAVGYGEWGPIDGWRRKKPEYWHMKKTYSPIKIHNKNIKKPEEGEAIFLQIENRYDFTNLKECSIEWSLGDEIGVLKPDIAPRSYGYAKVPYENITAKVLSIKVYDSFKRLIDKYELSIGDNGIPVYPNECIDFDNLSLKKDKEQIVISNEDLEWVFDAQSGEIIKAVVDGKKAISGGGTLMMLPLTTVGGQMGNGFEVEILNDPCTDWQADSIHAKEEEENIIVFIRGAYTEAEGHTVYTFKPNGEILVDYKFKTKIEINPRQIGLVFSVDKEYETLNWQRKTQWTVYPENHIGRVKGSAKLSDKDKYQFEYGVKPDWEWRHDNNFLGSNDFRSSKDFIYWASLTNNAGNGLVVLSDADDSFRAFADGNTISFLVAGFVTGGGDGFYSSHLKNERKKLKEGDEFIGSFKIKFTK